MKSKLLFNLQNPAVGFYYQLLQLGKYKKKTRKNAEDPLQTSYIVFHFVKKRLLIHDSEIHFRLILQILNFRQAREKICLGSCSGF